MIHNIKHGISKLFTWFGFLKLQCGSVIKVGTVGISRLFTWVGVLISYCGNDIKVGTVEFQDCLHWLFSLYHIVLV